MRLTLHIPFAKMTPLSNREYVFIIVFFAVLAAYTTTVKFLVDAKNATLHNYIGDTIFDKSIDLMAQSIVRAFLNPTEPPIPGKIFRGHSLNGELSVTIVNVAITRATLDGYTVVTAGPAPADACRQMLLASFAVAAPQHAVATVTGLPTPTLDLADALTATAKYAAIAAACSGTSNYLHFYVPSNT